MTFSSPMCSFFEIGKKTWITYNKHSQLLPTAFESFFEYRRRFMWQINELTDVEMSWLCPFPHLPCADGVTTSLDLLMPSHTENVFLCCLFKYCLFIKCPAKLSYLFDHSAYINISWYISIFLLNATICYLACLHVALLVIAFLFYLFYPYA